MGNLDVQSSKSLVVLRQLVVSVTLSSFYLIQNVTKILRSSYWPANMEYGKQEECMHTARAVLVGSVVCNRVPGSTGALPQDLPPLVFMVSPTHSSRVPVQRTHTQHGGRFPGLSSVSDGRWKSGKAGIAWRSEEEEEHFQKPDLSPTTVSSQLWYVHIRANRLGLSSPFPIFMRGYSQMVG